MDYSSWFEREIWPFLRGNIICETGEATPTKIGVHTCDINTYLHKFFEPILFVLVSPSGHHHYTIRQLNEDLLLLLGNTNQSLDSGCQNLTSQFYYKIIYTSAAEFPGKPHPFYEATVTMRFQVSSLHLLLLNWLDASSQWQQSSLEVLSFLD